MDEVAGLLAVLVNVELYQLGATCALCGLVFASILVSRWGGRK